MVPRPFQPSGLNERMLGVKGLRGVGKTTMLLQYLAFHYPHKNRGLYVTADQSALPWKDKHHGMFTYHVLNKLKESGGELTYGELSDYLRTRVATRSVMVNQREQNPQTNISPSVEGQDWRNWTIR